MTTNNLIGTTERRFSFDLNLLHKPRDIKLLYNLTGSVCATVIRFAAKKMLTQGLKGTKKDLMNPYQEAAMTATVSHSPDPAVALENCPLCDSPITRKQFVEIESRIREQEQRRLEQQRRSLEEHQRKLDEQYRVKTEAFRIETQNKAKAEADARVFTITRERDTA